MDSPDESFVTLNNYNFALSEEFGYLDQLSTELQAKTDAEKDQQETRTTNNKQPENTGPQK